MTVAAKIRLQTAGLLAIGFAGLLVYAFPGYMSSDSVAQLVDARSHQYSDWHPPAMAAMWTVVELVAKGPAGMLILQGTLFLLGTFGILRSALSPRTAAIASSAILLFPPVFTPMAVIWKDSQMAGFLLAAIALLLDPRRSRRCAGLVLLAVATALRDNAAAATLPLIAILFRGRPDQRWLPRIAIALGLWIATVAAARGANHALTKVELHAWYVSLGPSDIIGTLKQSRTYSDAELLQIFEGAPLVQRENIQPHARTHYNPTGWWYYMAGPLRVFDWPTTAEQRAAIARAWWQLVRDNPAAYFYHRLRVFRGVLGVTDRPVMDPVWHTHVALERLATADPYADATGAQAAIADGLTWVGTETPLYRPCIYWWVAIALLWLARRQPDVLALLVSGLTYELSLFPFAPSPDYRYSHWMVTATVISVVILFARRVHERSAQTRST